MKKIRHNSACVEVGALDRTGVIEAAYSGPLTAQAFDCLRSEVGQKLVTSACGVLRMEKTLDLMGHLQPPPPGSYPDNSPPAAVIVRLDQYDKWAEYARQAAKLGVMRCVFLESHASLAYEWALRQSFVRLQESQRLQRC